MMELLSTVRPSPAHDVEFMSALLSTVIPSDNDHANLKTMATRYATTSNGRPLLSTPELEMPNEDWMTAIDYKERKMDGAKYVVLSLKDYTASLLMHMRQWAKVMVEIRSITSHAPRRPLRLVTRRRKVLPRLNLTEAVCSDNLQKMHAYMK